MASAAVLLAVPLEVSAAVLPLPAAVTATAAATTETPADSLGGRRFKDYATLFSVNVCLAFCCSFLPRMMNDDDERTREKVWKVDDFSQFWFFFSSYGTG